MLVTTVGATLWSQGTGDPVARQCSPTVLVDLKTAVIGRAHVDTTVEALITALGADHVVRQDRVAEGHKEKAYAVNVCGHWFQRLWSGVAMTDTAFRTLEGVGPGSRVAAFDSTYGKPEISMEEGIFLRFNVRNASVNLIIDVEGACYRFEGGRAVGVDPACRATSMWFPLHHVLHE